MSGVLISPLKPVTNSFIFFQQEGPDFISGTAREEKPGRKTRIVSAPRALRYFIVSARSPHPTR
ncbi:MAG: hypothetical protein BWY80_01303 [Firmicutes bacterium ADurb.Bin456]|nr:MAG: hypothetical protein BWY80_01303 [Firmicutes bacterium ADurb.Bin456]